MKNLRLMCHFISSQSSVLQDHVMNSTLFASVMDVDGHPAPSSCLNACATLLELLDPFIDNPFQHDVVPIQH